ncbi:VC0807 family protein [Kitasatospora sp. NPDC089797]|uniref:VC0807 family protein n=1 Tax=Kitasatospora sp. NPDC089797 TaxID=3155298 RepID=UPI0034361ED4
MSTHQSTHPAPAKVRRASRPEAAPSARARKIGLAYDIGLSPATFYGCQAAGCSITVSLLAATGVAGARLLWNIVRNRRLDAVTGLVLAAYVLGLAIALPTHDARLLLLRDPATSALAGLVFLASCATRTPAMAYLARRLPERLPDTPAVRRGRLLSTALWGTGLLAEALVRMVLVFTLPVTVVNGLSTVVELVVVAGLVLWTRRYRRRMRAAFEAAAPAGAVGAGPVGAAVLDTDR